MTKKKSNPWRKLAMEQYSAIEPGTDMNYNWAEDPENYGDAKGMLTDQDIAKAQLQHSPYDADSFEPLPENVRVAPQSIWETLKQSSPEPTIFSSASNAIRRRMWKR